MNRLQTFSLLATLSLAFPSCMTTYDSYGRPVQSVDPGLAAVGIVGAVLVGAAIADSGNDHDYHRRPSHHGGHGGHGGRHGGGHGGHGGHNRGHNRHH